MPYTQWTKLDKDIGYAAAVETVDTLPPGHYALMLVPGAVVWTPVTARNDELIRFPESNANAVVEEIETFWGRQEEFDRHGLTFKRGILLWGPPGSGKTCTLQLIARDVIERGGIVLPVEKADVWMVAYKQLREIQPDVPIVAPMEDVDDLIEGNETRVLALLDGIEQVRKVVFLATTNYPEKLDARLANRPSRFDRRYLIGHPNAESRRIYLDTLERPGDAFDHERLVQDTEGMSLAHLKELFTATVVLGMPYDETVKQLQMMQQKLSSRLESTAERELERLLGRTYGGGYA